MGDSELALIIVSTKFRDFVSDFESWSQKSSSGEIGQNFKVFRWIKYYEIRINQIISYLRTSSIHIAYSWSVDSLITKDDKISEEEFSRV